MYQRNYLLLLLLLAVCHVLCAQQVIPVSRYGIRPDTRADMSPRIQKMLKDLRKRTAQGEEVVLQFAPGRYDFHPDRAAERTYYISNHDQDNPKRVGIPLEGLKNVTLDGGGASFVFHGRMLPLSLLESEGCTLKNFSIDFENPHIAQVRILSADTLNGVVFRPEPWVQWRLTPDSVFEAYGEGWTVRHSWGVVFEDSTKRLVYNSGDRACPTQGARLTDGGDIHAPRWKDVVLKPGMRFVMRGWGRPTPGIFLYKDKDTRLENIRIHYAEGMGVLAQVCEDITLDRLSVCLKGEDDPRCFTTQADATHFSGCKGIISSCGGLYEGMMDDAINVHGTYLKVVQRIDDHTLVGRYMHDQSWGFHWGDPGDSVQFIRAHTMELAGTANRIVSIRPHDRETEDGAREFRITFRDAIAPEIGTQDAYGIENLTWTPQVRFAGNTVRNNRARGALFSTPRRTVGGGQPLRPHLGHGHPALRRLQRLVRDGRVPRRAHPPQPLCQCAHQPLPVHQRRHLHLPGNPGTGAAAAVFPRRTGPGHRHRGQRVRPVRRTPALRQVRGRAVVPAKRHPPQHGLSALPLQPRHVPAGAGDECAFEFIKA